ncbi:hypothetical protein F5141DRAFT_624157 [Pisolithus sp. B1]|nr:hypothetical protein F5141DRAFT_624157 [Pisolithus sp. B1]
MEALQGSASRSTFMTGQTLTQMYRYGQGFKPGHAINSRAVCFRLSGQQELPNIFGTDSKFRLVYRPSPSTSKQTNRVNLRALASIPQPPNPPLPLPSEIYTYESSSGIENGNLPTPVAPPAADYFHIKCMIDPRGANRVRGRVKPRHRTTMERSPRASERISIRHAGHYYTETPSRTRILQPSAGPHRDLNIQASCGWQNEDGGLCGVSVAHRNCAVHFTRVHNIKNMAADVKVLYRQCPLSAEKKVIRHNSLRHLQEVHLCRPRSKKQDS